MSEVETGDAREYLRVLELAPGASMADVVSSHRVLLRIWDPDTLPDPERKAIASEKRRRIEQAYEWLCQHPTVLHSERAAVTTPPPRAAGNNLGWIVLIGSVVLIATLIAVFALRRT